MPLNTGNIGQTKSGWLNLGSESTTGLLASDFQTGGLGLFFSGLGVRGGNFLLATSTPAFGKVLMSTDDFGIAAWVATSTLGLGGGGNGYWTQTQAATSTAFLFPTATTTNVGIGTAVPSATLEVNGNIKLSGASPTYKLTNLATPTASSDAASKGYVDAQVGGGGIRYWEIKATTATYNGNLGGYAGANAKCAQEFGSGAVFFNSAILTSSLRGGPPIVPASNPNFAWWSALGFTTLSGTTGSLTEIVAPARFWFEDSYPSLPMSSCYGWTSPSLSSGSGFGSYSANLYAGCGDLIR